MSTCTFYYFLGYSGSSLWVILGMSGEIYYLLWFSGWLSVWVANRTIEIRDNEYSHAPDWSWEYWWQSIPWQLEAVGNPITELFYSEFPTVKAIILGNIIAVESSSQISVTGIHRSTKTLISRHMTQSPVPRYSDTLAYTLYHMVLGATPAIIPHALQQRYISLILLFLFKHA